MTLFGLSLVANTITLVVAIAAAIMHPTPGYRLIGVVAICAFIAATHQFATGEGSPLALPLNILLVVLLYYRRVLNRSETRKN